MESVLQHRTRRCNYMIENNDVVPDTLCGETRVSIGECQRGSAGVGIQHVQRRVQGPQGSHCVQEHLLPTGGGRTLVSGQVSGTVGGWSKGSGMTSLWAGQAPGAIEIGTLLRG